MKKDPGFIFRVFLMLGDTFAIIFSFALAYFYRTHIDQRPYYFESEIENFVLTIALLIPIWIFILASLGLYSKDILQGQHKSREITRLLAASAIGVMTIITYDFFGQNNLFPVRGVAIIAAALCFVSLTLIRALLKTIRRLSFRANYGTLRVIIIGNSKNTEHLAEHILNYPESGYRISAIIANNKYVPGELKKRKYSSLKEALKKVKADVIFQTDERQTEYVYQQSIKRHLSYYFVPSEAALSSHIGQLELIGNTPVISVNVTPLMSGSAKFLKRLTDLVLGGFITLIALIPMAIIWIIIKFSDLKSPATYTELRLSRYNRKVKITKFRSMKMEYNGLSPEEAFIKMRKPDLIKKYRKNGDYLKNDPRVTKFGKFIRKTSLDELPQLFSVLRGSISLVGPRALVPGELRDYGDRSLLLSVKSGLTGLAQISGRRDISFAERRSLDLYYIQNWSFRLDLSILIRTVGVVLLRKGAK